LSRALATLRVGLQNCPLSGNIHLWNFGFALLPSLAHSLWWGVVACAASGGLRGWTIDEFVGLKIRLPRHVRGFLRSTFFKSYFALKQFRFLFSGFANRLPKCLLLTPVSTSSFARNERTFSLVSKTIE